MFDYPVTHQTIIVSSMAKVSRCKQNFDARVGYVVVGVECYGPFSSSEK